MVSQLLPTFTNGGYVRLATTSGRVCVDGVPMDATGSRYWFKSSAPEFMEGFGKRLKLHAANLSLGFKKLDKKGKGVLWTICDCSVFSPERIIYDGQPSIEGHPRLSLGEPDITIHEGGSVDVG